jgi:PhzF family phenazine biosynthesis protein
MCKPSSAQADYLARFFAPISELPFAGHPTIAVAYSYCATNQEGYNSSNKTLAQECGIGIVSIDVS